MSFDNLQDIHPLLVKACNKLENRHSCDRINNSLDMIKYEGGYSYLRIIFTPVRYELYMDYIKNDRICKKSIKEIAQNENWNYDEYHNIKRKAMHKVLENYYIIFKQIEKKMRE